MTNEEVKVTGYNKEQLGTQKVVLEYKGFTETFVVTVTNDMVDMVIKTKIDKTTYYVGQELDLTGGILEVIFEDGSKQEIEMTSEEVKVTGYDKSVLGEQEITVNYKEFVVTFKVKVLSDEIIFEKYVPEITEEGNYIEEIYKNETIKDLKDDITTEGTIKIYNKEKEEILEDDVEMATGMTVEIILDDKVVTYEIVVTGDINGDGKVDIIDQSILAGYMVQEEKATEIMVGANLRASNIVKDDKFGNILDIAKLARVLVGLEEIK